jgi:glycopeptide antibiotics resistance protein
MRYLSQAFSYLGVSLAAALILYAPIFIIKRKKGVSWARQAVNYLFTVYCLFLAMALFNPTYAGHVSACSVNWIPFDAFRTTFVYDTSVAMTQYLLNILLFMPMGLLLPVVFPRRSGTLAKTLGWLAAIVVLAEAAQYLTGRVADIDDVINNILGGLAGFSLYILINVLLARLPGWRRLLTTPINTRAMKAWALVLLVLPWIPPAAAWGLDQFSEFAPLPAGIMLPEDTTITADTANLPTSAMVYVTSSMAKMDDIVTILQDAFGIQGTYHVDELGVSLSDSAAQCSIRVDNDGTWRVQYYGRREHCLTLAGTTQPPSDEDCTAKALAFFSAAGVETGSLKAEMVEDVTQTTDGKTVVLGRRVTFADTTADETLRISGRLSAEIGLDGTVLSGADDRLIHLSLREVPLRPVAEAVALGQKQGHQDPVIKSVTITSASLEYAVESRKHHYQPVWRVVGMATLTDGQTQPFQTTLQAMD